jgi:hypothetical protein
MDKPMLLGNINTIRITRGCTINGERYLPFDELTVNEATARQLIEENVAEVVRMEWDKGLKMHGASVQFRRK